MNRTLKIFCTGADQDRIADKCRVIERYAGFVLAEAPKSELKHLAAQFPVEDITGLYAVRAGGRAIDTSVPRVDAAGQLRPHPAYQGAKPLAPGSHHYLVQFIGPIKDVWLRTVKKAGGEPRAPYADFTYVVRADEDALRQIVALPFVRWTGHLSPLDRIAPSVPVRDGQEADSAVLPRTRIVPGVLTVEFFGSADLNAAVPAVKKHGFRVLSKDIKAKLLIVEANGKKTAPQFEALASVHGVRSIRARNLKRTCNDIATGIMGTASAMGNHGLGLSGQREYIGVCDTGLDTGDAQAIHPDFAGRVAWIKSYPITPDWASLIDNPGANDGPADVDSGHGTHVAGSVLGSGAASAGLAGLASPVRGLAYNARLMFQAVEQEMNWKPKYRADNERYVLSGIPLDLGKLFLDAYRRRVRIHSNSWGGGDPGAYDSQCEQLDRFVWEHRNFCVVFAAGNDGTDHDGDGKINPMSVTSPGTAKNCITVGACENRRTGFNSETYGKWWPSDYPVSPFRNNPMADNPDTVVAFSSRGPTQDGRIKPDVVAPGTFILSTRSTQIAANNKGWAAFPPSRLYFHMGGTSMATPLVAGAVALLREYLRAAQKIKTPTAALLKAALIAGATRLPQYGVNSAVADNDQGYGRVNLDAVVAPAAPASARFMEVKPGLKTGEVYAADIAVKSENAPLRVVLAYTDYPGPALVNNLNLILTAPDGTRYAGNQKAGGALTLDARNNVEAVQVAKPAPGKWKLQVVGSNVPHGPQAFAVVCLAHFG